jgi:heavy metal translocating P-type ATPase
MTWSPEVSRDVRPWSTLKERADDRDVRPPQSALPSSPWRSSSVLLLGLSGACLLAGGVLKLAGEGSGGDAAWIVCGGLGAAYSLWTMLASLRRGRVGVDAIAFLAVVGALAVGEYLAAAVISVMMASGRALEAWAAGRATRDLRRLLERAPARAHRYQSGGTTLETIDVADVNVGDRVMVPSGEPVPTDGVLLTEAVIDESVLTGEPLPVTHFQGDLVRSGTINAGSPLDMQATAPASESAYAGIVRLVAAAQSSPAPFVRLADRYAVGFLVLSLVVAAGAWVAAGPQRAVAVLVVASPCPLILAAPVALVGGLSRSARRGVVVKGAGVLERLGACTTLLIDKTGTLTSGHPTLTNILPVGALTPEQVLTLAASLDQVSSHLLARSLVDAARLRGCQLELPQEVEEVAGSGVKGAVGGHKVALGKASWVGVVGSPPWAKVARRRAQLDGSLTVFVSVDGRPAGVLVLDDSVRPDAARTIHLLRNHGIKRIVMVTGDRTEVAEAIGAVTGVDEVLAERSPEDKLDAVRAERAHGGTIMVGDGINDAPALALADVGVAMGARGASASTETADVVLTVDRLDRLGEAHSLARRSRRIALQSVIAGMGMSLTAMGFAAVGLLPAVWGAILQEGIDVAVILNALRTVRSPTRGPRLDETQSRLARRFQREHLMIKSDLDRLLAVADSLGTTGPEQVMDPVREVYRLLAEEVEPHEEAEEHILYPALERVLGGNEPTGPMSRAHAEISHQIRRLGHLIEDIGTSVPDQEDIDEIRRLLYGLHAILRLHTLQEEESYLSLEDETPAAPHVDELSV